MWQWNLTEEVLTAIIHDSKDLHLFVSTAFTVTPRLTYQSQYNV